jgi:hypothetical protein
LESYGYYFYNSGLYFMVMEHEIESGLDRDRIEELSVEVMRPIQRNYRIGPISRDRVYEALNALAFAAATVVEGCDRAHSEAHDFFMRAYEMQRHDLRKHPPNPEKN